MEDIVIKDKIFYNDVDNEVHKKLCKEIFLKSLNELDFDFELLYDNFKTAYELSAKFNHFLKSKKEELGINISEMILFLEEDNYRLQRLLAILDEDNKVAIKMELSRNFRSEQEINSIDNIVSSLKNKTKNTKK